MVWFKYIFCMLVTWQLTESAHIKVLKQLETNLVVREENPYKGFKVVGSNWPDNVQKELADEYQIILNQYPLTDVFSQVFYYTDYLCTVLPNQTISMSVQYDAVAIEESKYIVYLVDYQNTTVYVLITATKMLNGTDEKGVMKKIEIVDNLLPPMTTDEKGIQIQWAKNVSNSTQQEMLRAFEYVIDKFSSPEQQVQQYQLLVNFMFPNYANFVVKCLGIVAYQCDWYIGFIIDSKCQVMVWGTKLSD